MLGTIEEYFSKMVGATCVNWQLTHGCSDSQVHGSMKDFAVHHSRMKSRLRLEVLEGPGSNLKLKGEGWVANVYYKPEAMPQEDEYLLYTNKRLTTILDITLLYPGAAVISAAIAARSGVRVFEGVMDENTYKVLEAMGFLVRDCSITLSSTLHKEMKLTGYIK